MSYIVHHALCHSLTLSYPFAGIRLSIQKTPEALKLKFRDKAHLGSSVRSTLQQIASEPVGPIGPALTGKLVVGRECDCFWHGRAKRSSRNPGSETDPNYAVGLILGTA
jgi:hypothetical protein